MDIGVWLRDLGLERYEQAFRENEIDAEILPKLTADDLREIGVTTVGHRRKLLEAIKVLSEPALASRIEVVPPAEAVTRPRPRSTQPERRQLTVMFCDLVGSTELAARFDPEDVGQVTRAYQVACTAVIERWEGHVARYMGDGVLAYFGWPRAHEDDAERAVRSALATIDAVVGLETSAGEGLAARIGIATGLVMVGELIGHGEAQEQTVAGETPNLAARLQALAEPGAIVISGRTRRLVGELFELTDLGPQRLKGFDEPITAYCVEGESRAEGRFEALHGRHLTPLVGREHELGILLERWAWAKDRDGQVMLLSGEPGIGKSRLVHALREQVEVAQPTVLSHYCSLHHVNSALQPVIDQLERATGMRAGDTAATRLDRLEAFLAPRVAGDHEAVPLIAALLSIPTVARYPPLSLSPQRRMQRTMEILLACVAGAARDGPVLVLYEDVHWIDPTTQTLLGLLVEHVADLSVLVVITFRPEFSPPWTGHAHVTSLQLSRLARRQGTTMVEELAGAKPLPARMIEQIVARTDGVPLFVEELTKTVLESDLLRDAGDRWDLGGPLPALTIPSTLRDSLMARLDRLASVKEVAQIGAAIGRVFSHQLLAAVSPLDDKQLRAALDRLTEAGLVFRHGSPPAVSYTFKHALVQDAAYQSLLKSLRVDLHGRIADVLKRDFPELVNAQPELLAHHQTEAGLTTQATDSWLRAGEHAQARSAHLEAIAHLKRGLALVGELPDAAEQARHELDFHAALGISLLATKGFAAPEVGQSYAKAEALSEQTGITARLYAILQGLWFHHTVRCELKRGLELAQRCYRIACDGGDPAHLLAAHHVLCHSHFFFGSFEDSRMSLHEALRLADQAEQESVTTLMGADLAVFTRAFGAHTMWHLGFPEQASWLSDQAVRLAEGRQDPFSLGLALDYAAMLKQLAGDRNAAKVQATEAIELCRAQHFAYYLAWARMIYGWSLAGDSHADDCLNELRTGLDAFEATGAALRRPYYWSLLAEVEACAGRSEDALVLLDDAIVLVEQTGERWHEAELHRLKGQLLLQIQPSRPDQAEVCLQQALVIARRQAARAPELKAALDLARLWAEGGERRMALDLLAPVYDQFTEGFDTRDLVEARALLDTMA